MTMQLIQYQELSSPQSSIVFSNIAQDGTDLLLITSLRDTSSFAGWAFAYVRPNQLTTNMSARYFYAWSTNLGVATDTVIYHLMVGGADTTNTFSNSSVYISNYAVAAANNIATETVTETNGTNAIKAISYARWNSTDAITSLSIVPERGQFAAGSSASLYKITKGSDGIVTIS